MRLDDVWYYLLIGKITFMENRKFKILSMVSFLLLGVTASAYDEDASRLSFKTLGSGPADDWRCGVTVTDNVYCWGNNSWGNLGDPEVYPRDENNNPVVDGAQVKGNFSARPVAVKVMKGGVPVILSDIKNVAMGNRHACAVTNGGEVYCWGSNNHGQLGNVPFYEEISPDLNNHQSFVAVKVLKGQQENNPSEYLTRVEYLQLGQDHSCALTVEGEVYCWGDNSTYQLGGDYDDFLKGGLEHRKTIVNHSGEITLENYVRDVNSPVRVVFPDTVDKVNSLGDGLWSHCALVANADKNDHHNLYCWGSERMGTISHNFKQYLPDFKEKVHGRLFMKGVEDRYDYKEIRDWLFVDKEENLHPFYGQGVTRIEGFYNTKPQIESFKTDEEVERFIEKCEEQIDCLQIAPGKKSKKREVVANVKSYGEDLEALDVTYASFRFLDGNICLSRKDDQGRFYLTWYGTYVDTYFPDKFSQVKKLYSSAYEDSGCLLLGKEEGERVYCFGNSSIRLMGNGLKEDGFGYYFVVNPDWSETDNSGSYLQHVKELSVNRNSICALVADDEVHPGENNIYCWGISLFGQMGFDNGKDHELSYKDTIPDQLTTQSKFKILNDPDRQEIKPRKIVELTQIPK